MENVGAALDSNILRCGKCIEMLFREAIGVGGLELRGFGRALNAWGFGGLGFRV